MRPITFVWVLICVCVCTCRLYSNSQEKVEEHGGRLRLPEGTVQVADGGEHETTARAVAVKSTQSVARRAASAVDRSHSPPFLQVHGSRRGLRLCTDQLKLYPS